MTVNNSPAVRSVSLPVPSIKSRTGVGQLMGAILVDAGRLTELSVEQILSFQQERGGRFGEAGQALGLLTEEDVRFALSVQFDYPYLAPESKLSHDLVAAYHPNSTQVEELRALRSQLMLRWFSIGTGRNGLAVVSAGRKDGRSYLAANLAIVFSQLGERTLLIDADLRTPRQHKLFNLGERAGLSDVIVGRAGLDAITAIPGLSSLSVLPSGTIPPNPQELLGRSEFSSLLGALGEDFGVMIIDTPAANSCADAQTVAARAGAALMVARQNTSSIPQLARFTRSLREFGVTLVGSVLNDV